MATTFLIILSITIIAIVIAAIVSMSIAKQKDIALVEQKLNALKIQYPPLVEAANKAAVQFHQAQHAFSEATQALLIARRMSHYTLTKIVDNAQRTLSAAQTALKKATWVHDDAQKKVVLMDAKMAAFQKKIDVK